MNMDEEIEQQGRLQLQTISRKMSTDTLLYEPSREKTNIGDLENSNELDKHVRVSHCFVQAFCKLINRLIVLCYQQFPVIYRRFLGKLQVLLVHLS